MKPNPLCQASQVSGENAHTHVHAAVQKCASEDVAVPTVQCCKRQMPEKLKGRICDEQRSVLSKCHSSCSHLIRIMHQHKEHSPEKYCQPFPLYKREEPWLNEAAKADLFTQGDDNKIIEQVCDNPVRRQKLRM